MVVDILVRMVRRRFERHQRLILLCWLLAVFGVYLVCDFSDCCAGIRTFIAGVSASRLRAAFALSFAVPVAREEGGAALFKCFA